MGLNVLNIVTLIICIISGLSLLVLFCILCVYCYFRIKDIYRSLSMRYESDNYKVIAEKKKLERYLEYKKIEKEKRKLSKKPFFYSLFLFLIFKEFKETSNIVEEFEQYRLGYNNIEEVEKFLNKEDDIERLAIEKKIKNSQMRNEFDQLEKLFEKENSDYRTMIIRSYLNEVLLKAGLITPYKEETCMESTIKSAYKYINVSPHVLGKNEFTQDILAYYKKDICKRKEKLSKVKNEKK